MGYSEFIEWVNQMTDESALTVWELDKCTTVMQEIMESPVTQWEDRWNNFKESITRLIIDPVNKRVAEADGEVDI